MIKSFTKLKVFTTIKDRYNFLKLSGRVGESTFGYDRYLNQKLYRSKRWLAARDKVIIRDNGCDLGIPGYKINDFIVIHHMNPITIEDIENDIDELYDPEYLICVSDRTHKALHFSNASLLPTGPVTRRRNDTIPWL